MKHTKNTLILLVLAGISQLASALDENIIKQGKTQDGKTQFELFTVKTGNSEKTYYKINEEGKASPSYSKSFNSHIKIRDFDFDPLQNPVSSSNNASTKLEKQADGNATGVYLIQLFTHPTESYSEEIKNLGCNIIGFVPRQTYVVHCSSALAQKLQSLDYVRSVSEYKSDYKIQKKTANNINQRRNQKSQAAAPRQRYIVSLFSHDKSDLVDFEQFLALNHIEIAVKNSLKTGFPEVNLTDAQLQLLIAHTNVQAVDEWAPPELDMNIVREVGGANYVEQQVGSYTGLGVTGEVVDLGAMAHASFQHLMTYGSLGLNDNVSTNTHGTSTYGIIFSNGQEDPTKPSAGKHGRGLLPDATGIFSSKDSANYSRAQDLADMTNPAGPYRILFQSNSWGQPVTTTYNVWSQQLDQAIYDNDVIVLQSQGNQGASQTTTSRPEAWAKNVVSVGGVAGKETVQYSDDNWDDSSSHGPSATGRIKPDFVHFSDGVFTASALNKYSYASFTGTSASTPIVAGHFGLMFQMWSDGIFTGGYPGRGLISEVFANKPHAATAKALMVNTAAQYDFDGVTADMNRFHQGWGLPNVKNLYDLAKNNSWNFPLVINGSDHLKQAEEKQYTIHVNGTGASFLKVTMVYMDPPISVSDELTNDLDLKIISPSGVIYWGNNGLDKSNWSIPGGTADAVNTVENIFIKKPESGDWKIITIASRVYPGNNTTKDSTFGLVVSCDGTSACTRVNVNSKPDFSWFIPVMNLILFN